MGFRRGLCFVGASLLCCCLFVVFAVDDWIALGKVDASVLGFSGCDLRGGLCIGVRGACASQKTEVWSRLDSIFRLVLWQAEKLDISKRESWCTAARVVKEGRATSVVC